MKITAKYQLEGGRPSFTRGTGFVVACEGNERVGIVSNRHILDKTWLEPLWRGASLELAIDVWINRTTKKTYRISPLRTYSHDDESIDVAVIPVDRFHRQDRPDSPVYLQSALPWEFLMKAQEDWHLLEPSETVFFSGYPEWYDRSAGRPIMRTGAIISDPQYDYRYTDGPPTNEDGNRQILFEAFSSSGNSGSPVFVAQRGLPSSDHIKYNGVFHPSLLVGINAGHIPIRNPVEDREGNIHLTHWHVGLSRMFKVSTIIDVVRDMAERHEWS